MAYSAVLNCSASANANTTDNGACLPTNNQPVTNTLAVSNTGGTAVTITDAEIQNVRKAYGPIADTLYSALVGQTVPATGTLYVTWPSVYSNSGPAEPYGVDVKLQLSDGTIVTPAVAPGSITLTCTTVLAGDTVVIDGVTFTGSSTTSFINGVGAPAFYVGANDGACATNLKDAINAIFGAGAATVNSNVVTCIPPIIAASNPAGTIAVAAASTITVGTSFASDINYPGIVITGRQTAGKGGNLATYTFQAVSDNTYTAGTGAPQFYVGANANAYAANLAAAMVALFGTATAVASNNVITLGATLVSGDFGVGAGAAQGAPSLTVSSGTNVVSPQPNIYQLYPGTAIAVT